MSLRKSIHTIILDTGPILQNNPSASTLRSRSDSLFTTPSVTSEIRDASARNLFNNTLQPFLNIKTPSLVSVKFVTDFARRTGDLATLSKTDVEVIALAYELDCERNGGDSRLRKSPGQKGSNISQQGREIDQHDVLDASPAIEKPPRVYEPTTAAPWASALPLPSPATVPPESIELGNQSDEQSKDAEEPAVGTSGSHNGLSMEDASSKSDFVAECGPNEPSMDLSPPPADTDDSLSESSEGWITPSNIKRTQATEEKGHSSPITQDSSVQVAIITADFAMQNVILQIGLTLVSPTLQRIRNIRTYILRCHACFQTVKDTSKQFCPRCGKLTLTRVSCSTSEKGEFKIHLKKNMQWNHRGDRYSIPKPVPGQANGKVGMSRGGGKGGWGQELILAEDQKEYQRAMGRSTKAKGTDFMDADYLPQILTGERGRAGGRPKVGAGRNVNSKKRA